MLMQFKLTIVEHDRDHIILGWLLPRHVPDSRAASYVPDEWGGRLLGPPQADGRQAGHHAYYIDYY